MVHQRDPDMAPDSDFEPGGPEHIVVGNRGRLLDPRRTPITIVDLHLQTGCFDLRIDGFEDRGAVWRVPLEDVRFYQFAIGSPRAAGADVAAFRDLVRRFDVPLEIPLDEGRRARTAERLARAQADAAAWLARSSRFFQRSTSVEPAPETGHPALQEDLRTYLATLGLDAMEHAFAAQYVSNPESGELVKGHRIVIAELGLVPFTGKRIRDPGLFDGDWSRERRGRHVVARLAFVRATFARSGLETVALYRGLWSDRPPRRHRGETFVSTSSSFEVARSCFDTPDPRTWGLLARAPVPVARLFMTHLETAEMNRQFREREYVLLEDPQGPAF